jgi:hypothetical protein
MIPRHCLDPRRQAQIGDWFLGLLFAAFFAVLIRAVVPFHG